MEPTKKQREIIENKHPNATDITIVMGDENTFVADFRLRVKGKGNQKKRVVCDNVQIVKYF